MPTYTYVHPVTQRKALITFFEEQGLWIVEILSSTPQHIRSAWGESEHTLSKETSSQLSVYHRSTRIDNTEEQQYVNSSDIHGIYDSLSSAKLILTALGFSPLPCASA